MHVHDDLRSFYAGRRVCVTGGAGFIGSHLCDALVKLGSEVSVIDDLSSGDISNLDDSRGSITFHEASLLDDETVRDAVRDASVLFHQAALCAVPRSVEEPLAFYETNITATAKLAEHAREAGVHRIVFASSSSVYGDAPPEHARQPKQETAQRQTLSPYAASKAAGEHILAAHANCYDIDTVSLRYFNIFGPRQRPDSAYAAVIPRFADALLRGEPATIYGDGQQTRDFTHVANAVRANLLAGSVQRQLNGVPINIACGQSYSLLQLLDAIANALDVEPRYELHDPRTGDIIHSLADINRARELLAYEPVVNFTDGITDAVAHYQQTTTAHRN